MNCATRLWKYALSQPKSAKTIGPSRSDEPGAVSDGAGVLPGSPVLPDAVVGSESLLPPHAASTSAPMRMATESKRRCPVSPGIQNPFLHSTVDAGPGAHGRLPPASARRMEQRPPKKGDARMPRRRLGGPQRGYGRQPEHMSEASQERRPTEARRLYIGGPCRRCTWYRPASLLEP